MAKGRMSTSSYRGVSWHPESGCWRVIIEHRGRTYHLGCFELERMAALAHDQAARRLHGERAKLIPRQGPVDLPPWVYYHPRARNKTGFRGGAYRAHLDKYVARLGGNGRRKAIWRGPFATAKEAARAYDRLAVEHCGIWAKLNFPREMEIETWIKNLPI